MDTESVLIIGGGLGGLFTGALLAKEGVRVTIIEKNANCGGGLQSFRRFGEVFDTGMHVFGGMRDGGNIRRICDYLGISDKMHLRDVDSNSSDVVHIAEDGMSYRIAEGKEGFIDSLSSYFPDQKDNLRRYVDALYSIVDELDLFYLRPSGSSLSVHSDEFLMSVDSFIAKYISDTKLRSVLAYLSLLYSGRRGVTPAYIHALISVLHINGPSRFEGGSQLFADTLKDFIISHNGEVVLSDAVKTIHTQGRLITGVETRKGRIFTAERYISDIHPCTLFSLFDDPSAFPRAYRRRLESLPNSCSAFSLNIVLKPGTFRYVNHSDYYISTYNSVWNFGDHAPDWPQGFLYMTPPDIAQGEFARKMVVVAPMSWSFVEKWENSRIGKRPEEYGEWKRQCADKLIDSLERFIPGLRNCIEEYDCSSPLTIRDWYGVKEGSMYGFSKDCNNITASHLPIATKIPNLLLTGQNCNVHGFCGVTLVAVSTAEAVLGTNRIVNRIIGSEK